MNDEKQLQVKIDDTDVQAKSLQIVDTISYEKGGAMLVGIKGLLKEVNKSFDPIIEKAYAAHREACNQKNIKASPLKEAKMLLNTKMGTYTRQEEEKRRLVEIELQAKAKKEAEDRQIAEAAALEKVGKKEEAKQVIEQEVPVAPVVVEKTTPKVRGTSTRTWWKFNIVDETKIPFAYLMPNTSKIQQAVNLNKQNTQIPGIKVYPDTKVV